MHDKYQAAKELGEEWGCPNWKPAKVSGDYITLPEHALEALHASIEPPKNKRMLSVIRGYESFLAVPVEARGTCYKTCPNFYQTTGSPLAAKQRELAEHQHWFRTGQYSEVNSDPTRFDIQAQNALLLGQSLVESWYTKKMAKENEENKKQIESERRKKK